MVELGANSTVVARETLMLGEEEVRGTAATRE